MRLTESIVRECMNLQINSFELGYPLVEMQKAQIYSPWRETKRPVGEVLRDLWGFAVIHTLFETLADSQIITSAEKVYVAKRRNGIIRESAQAADLASEKGLTLAGREVARYLLDCLDL